MKNPMDTLKQRAKDFAEEKDLKQKLIDKGDRAVQKLIGGIAGRVSDKTVPFLNRYDNTGFLEGNGYFLPAPAEGAKWSVGFCKDSILPETVSGDLYIGGYLAFPPNKAAGRLNDQMVRAFAFDDGSGRGLHVFAVIDCVGISNHDIRLIRERIRPLISERNILSVNISATHCHSGVDTQGVWGDLIEALKKNPKAVKKQKTLQNAVSGKNPDFMAYLTEVAAETIIKAVAAMTPGSLSFALLPAGDFIRDKRPPYVLDDTMTVLRFVPDTPDKKKILGVILSAHPTNYGDKQKQISADFPYYVCDELEKAGYDAAYFQSDELAVATDRGKFTTENATRAQGIEQYGRAIGDYVLNAGESAFTPIAPLLNVKLIETFIPVDNALMTLLGKLKLVSNNILRVTSSSAKKPKKDEWDYYFATEVGYAEFGTDLKLALIPGEIAPEIVVGGAYSAEESYNGTAWTIPPLKDAVTGRLSVIGLCNDAIAYIIPDNDFGSVFAPLHYEESVSAGGRTGSNIAHAFLRCVEEAKKCTVPAGGQRMPGEE